MGDSNARKINIPLHYDNKIVVSEQDKVQGRVVRKPVNANPGLKVNRGINFSCLKMFFTFYLLCSMRLLKF